MEHSTILLFLLVALIFCGNNDVVARKIKHLVVREKIDRVGNVQDGGAGETTVNRP